MYGKLLSFWVLALILLAPVAAKAQTEQLAAQPVAQVAEVNTIMMDFLTQSMVKVGNQVLDAYLVKKFNLPPGYVNTNTGTNYNYGTTNTGYNYNTSGVTYTTPSYNTNTGAVYNYGTTGTNYTYSTTNTGMTLSPSTPATTSASSSSTYNGYGDYVPGMESEQMIPVQ